MTVRGISHMVVQATLVLTAFLSPATAGSPVRQTWNEEHAELSRQIDGLEAVGVVVCNCNAVVARLTAMIVE